MTSGGGSNEEDVDGGLWFWSPPTAPAAAAAAVDEEIVDVLERFNNRFAPLLLFMTPGDGGGTGDGLGMGGGGPNGGWLLEPDELTLSLRAPAAVDDGRSPPPPPFVKSKSVVPPLPFIGSEFGERFWSAKCDKN